MPEDDDAPKPTTIAGFTPVGSTGGIGHMLAQNSPNCPKCGAPPANQEVRNYDEIWRDGDVYCMKCNTRVRSYDAG
jgi:hypothetical protein